MVRGRAAIGGKDSLMRIEPDLTYIERPCFWKVLATELLFGRPIEV